MEVLVALGIFGLGMIAIASIFPVAILMQRETMFEVEGSQFSRNAEAAVGGAGFAASDWSNQENNGDPDDGVTWLPEEAYDAWPIEDRSYNVSDPSHDRRVYWVPLVYDVDPRPGEDETSWRVFLFILRARENYVLNRNSFPNVDKADHNEDHSNSPDPIDVPAVFKAQINTATTAGNTLTTTPPEDISLLRVGDEIVDQHGVVRTVLSVNRNTAQATVDGDFATTPPTYYWYAHPGFDRSGTRLPTSSFVDVVTLLEKNNNTLIREIP